MRDYCFFQKDDQIIALEIMDVDRAFQLIEKGFKKQFEEVSALNEEKALARFEDIRRNNQTDHKNFLAGAIAMPVIGALTAFTTYLFQKKWLKRK
ncbi:hypothetical protein [Klebsiella sp. BIGb0407]|uniref:hypothetical protein n=1 Tax=Klebsiella sp. BIGb0407 TaxID=2940603 RepID=UPI002169D1C1|nr:hypothetical protein [Klebsiella sp. BIGb0407]MCS3433447.1 hypothetical protein [Klebsiella sp. BIGb0407]